MNTGLQNTGGYKFRRASDKFYCMYRPTIVYILLLNVSPQKSQRSFAVS